MRVKNALSLTLLLVAAMSVGGCGGGGAKVTNNTSTMGQELSDLDKAYKGGLMSESEYSKARKSIMKRYK